MANSVFTANERGAWAVGTTYAAYDVVDFDGYKYGCNSASTGNDPSGDTAQTYWTVISAELGVPDPTGKNAVLLNESAYTAVDGDTIFASVNTTITLPLPNATGDNGAIVVISNGGSITATVAAPAGGSTVNGSASVTVTTQYTRKTFYSDGFNWFAA